MNDLKCILMELIGSKTMLFDLKQYFEGKIKHYDTEKKTDTLVWAAMVNFIISEK